MSWAGCSPCHQWGLAAHERVKGATRRARLPGTRHNKLAGGIPRLLIREKTRPARHQTPAFGHCEHAGRQIPRTARRNIATLKPTTPLHAPNKGPLKPPSPLRPQTAPKTLISHPQRRRRFQTHTGTSKQRRQGFQLRLSLREQRRRRFHTTGPPGRQGQAAVPAGPEAMSGPAISHLVSPTRTLTR